MLCFDLIIYICEYLEDTNYYLLNKSIYQSVIMIEKGKYWKEKYDNFFKNLNKEYLILSGDYNWKQEYIRILKFNNWSKLNNTSQFLANTIYIPDDEQHQNLNEYSWNQLPKEIGNLIDLKAISIIYGNIEEIPKEIGNLVNLELLDLRSNKIKKIPKEIVNLSNLLELALPGNKIEEIPKEISNLIKLKVLVLSFNEIKEIPKEISNLRNLEFLALRENNVLKVPKELDNLTKLKYYDQPSERLMEPYLYFRNNEDLIDGDLFKRNRSDDIFYIS